MPLTHTTEPTGDQLREIEVQLLELAAGGASTTQLAAGLHCSDAELRHLIAVVEQRLDCDSLSCAAAAAAATGAIHAPA
ncbi:MAG TPA: hypothetical protein VFN44_01765 [Solirubrobacteraceae bacterium]|nr:hypothetical protein [Solirubrobacteraceae bacterium]